jgi:putative membrane protein
LPVSAGTSSKFQKEATMYPYSEHMWFGGWMMMFPSLIFIVLLILVILFLGGKNRSFDIFRRESETPLEILKKHYAKGEISREQFEQMKKDIS